MNPAFAIAEVIWIVAGRNDSAFLNYWNPRLPTFAGHGKTYHGAYGYRLKKQFGVDQLARAATILTNQPDTRQVALQIWDVVEDLPSPSGKPRAPDIPCNLLSLLKVREGRLEWTQVIRSNDLFLGVPHNFVQFTSLQEIIAGWIGASVGTYTQMSDSLHVYERDLESIAGVSQIGVKRNTDSLALGRDASKNVMKSLGRKADRLTRSALTRREFRSILKASLPTAYQNLLLMLLADAARRRGWLDEMGESSETCRSEALVQLWSRWLSRAGLGTDSNSRRST